MSEKGSGEQKVVLAINGAGAVAAVADFTHLVKHSSMYCREIFEDIEAGKLEEAKGKLLAMSDGMMQAMLELMKRHSAPESAIPEGLREKMKVAAESGLTGVIDLNTMSYLNKETVH